MNEKKSASDDEIKNAAVEFARKNRKQIVRQATDRDTYQSDDPPISVFMAGSPGAGKTEYSKNLLKILEKGITHKVLRIDTDDLRVLLPGYTGSNSYLFQVAVTLIAEKIHDAALKQKQSFVFDGTFSKYDKAALNIQRSLDHGRPVQIFYVYQKPEVAWRFTQQREQAEGRNIPKEVFIEQFLGARQTVARIHSIFGSAISITLVQKDFEQDTVEKAVQIGAKNDPIDSYIKETYTIDELNGLL